MREENLPEPKREQLAISEADLRQWVVNCDPRQPVGPDDERYYDLSHVEIDGEVMSLRGDFQLERLRDAIELLEDGSCQLFSGFSGTGKSTELRRLAHDLEESGYTVLLVDMQEYHNLYRELTIEDLLVILAGAFGEAAGEKLGKDMVSAGYWQRLKEFLQQDLKVGDFKVPAGVTDLKVGIEHAKPFWVEMREALGKSLGKLGKDVHAFIAECVRALETRDRQSKGVIFIADSLERLRAPKGHFQDVMESVTRVFLEHADLLRFPDCHVVYTVPPYVQLVSIGLSERYDRVGHVLPAVKVMERGAELRPYAPGIKALSELAGRRLDLDRVFGERRDLLERLILYSGGHVRTFISFLRELLLRSRQGGLPPSDEEIEHVVQPLREQARLGIVPAHARLLAVILESGTLEGIAEEDHPTLARFMDDHLVLCYRNGDGWYEVHPLVRDYVERLVRAPKGDEGE